MFDEDGKKSLVFELMRGGELLDKILRQKFFRLKSTNLFSKKSNFVK